jgi:exopolyphosphatase / guanosine-5'-triphosphate,3'-diphosphate pyrophosphatase
MNHAVIDLGPENVRLIIFAAPDQETPAGDGLQIILNDKSVAGLATYVEGNIFTQKGIERSVKIIEKYLATIRGFGDTSVKIFATAFLRKAYNSEEARKAIEERVGHEIHIITDEEEAYLFLASQDEVASEEAVLIDIAGGATEISVVNGANVTINTSLPIGSLSLYIKHVMGILPTHQERIAIYDQVMGILKDCSSIQGHANREIYCVGGTSRGCYRFVEELAGENEDDTFVITRDEIITALDLCDVDFRRVQRAALKVAPDRIHTVLPGLVAIYAIMNFFEAEQITVTKPNETDGYLFESADTLKEQGGNGPFESRLFKAALEGFDE